MDTPLQLEESLRVLIDDLPPVSPDVCIYRVPKELRSVNEKAYTPQRVSIGPMHYGKIELHAMEEHKLRCMQAFLKRTKTSLEGCIRVVKELEERARNCYAERIDLTSDQFVKMLFVDSCLIIEIMLRDVLNEGESIDNLRKHILTFGLSMDLVLLENQLPFFVLDCIFKQGFSNYLNTYNFLELSVDYFDNLVMLVDDRQTKIDNVMQHLKRGNEVKHFVDLLRMCQIPSNLRLSDNKRGSVPIRNATYLQEAGINIKSGSSNCALDITYTTGVLKIPHMYVADQSEYVLRNIVALESCHYPYDSYMIDYIFFMDMLINTAEDVDMLIQKGILKNWLSDSSAVANLFNGLGIAVTMYSPKYLFHNISVNMNAYCNVRKHRWRATFVRDYCNTPWMVASTIAAIILLLLTLIQTICSIISLIV